jgi:Mrp family chromosome partitioning ATPase
MYEHERSLHCAVHYEPLSQDVTIESLKFWVYDTDKSAGRIVMTVVGNARVGKQTSYFALETAVAER